MSWLGKPSSRLKLATSDLRFFINSLRETMGKDVLYPTCEPTTEERFHMRPHTVWDGKQTPRYKVPH